MWIYSDRSKLYHEYKLSCTKYSMCKTIMELSLEEVGHHNYFSNKSIRNQCFSHTFDKHLTFYLVFENREQNGLFL